MGRPRTVPSKRVKQGGTPGQNAVSHRKQPTTPVLSQRVVRASDLEVPKGLPPDGVDLWHDLVQELASVGAAQKKDVPALRLMCMHYGFAMLAARVLAEQGTFASGSMGQMVDHPANRQFHAHSTAYLRYAREFGGTLSSALSLDIDALTRDRLDSVNDRLGANPRKARSVAT